MVCGRFFRFGIVALAGLSLLAVSAVRSDQGVSPRPDQPEIAASRPADAEPAADSSDADRSHRTPGPWSGRRPRDHRHGPDRRPSERWGELERQKVRDFIDTHFPEAAQELRSRSEQNPQMGERILSTLMPEMTRLLRSYEEDPPDLFNLRLESAKNEMAMRRLMREYRHASGEDRDRIREAMRQHVVRDVQLREEIGRQELRRLEEGVERLRARLDEMDARRDEIIEEELELRLRARPPGRGPGHSEQPPRSPRGRWGRPDSSLPAPPLPPDVPPA